MKLEPYSLGTEIWQETKPCHKADYPRSQGVRKKEALSTLVMTGPSATHLCSQTKYITETETVQGSRKCQGLKYKA